MRVFKTKWFIRFCRREKIDDSVLCRAAADVNLGRIDANLGGGVIKQRIARTKAGKSGGYRLILLFKKSDKTFFVYGFSKSDRENISKDELVGFKKLAEEMLAFDDAQLSAALKNGAISEVSCDEYKDI